MNRGDGERKTISRNPASAEKSLLFAQHDPTHDDSEWVFPPVIGGGAFPTSRGERRLGMPWKSLIIRTTVTKLVRGPPASRREGVCAQNAEDDSSFWSGDPPLLCATASRAILGSGKTREPRLSDAVFCAGRVRGILASADEHCLDHEVDTQRAPSNTSWPMMP